MSIKNRLKNLRKSLQSPKLIGTVAYYVSKLISFTLRIKIISHASYDNKKQYLFAFWHGKQFLPVIMLKNHDCKKAALVSPSRDGSILEQWLKKLNYEVERGSSRDQNVKSLVRMVKLLKNGYTLGFGIDGPTGPIYKVKPGMTYMAQKTGVPIIPLASYCPKKWVFEKAWDKYEIPKPFSKVLYYIGEPIYINKGEDLDKANLELENSLNDLQHKAKSII